MEKERCRIPLGLVTNALAYGSLYGRGEPANQALRELETLLEPFGLTIEDVRNAIREGRYRVRRVDR